MKFNVIETQVGITKLSEFRSSGKFICEKKGLYLISVYMYSDTNGAQYYIYKNRHIVSKLYIGTHSIGWAHTGTGVVSVDLQVGDAVWIKVPLSLSVGIQYSCLTIVKIK